MGSGQANTTAMMANGATSYVADTSGAAEFADSSTCGTKSDWFLGSIGEMMLMYTNLQGVGGFSPGFYWSSSGYDDVHAWILHFGDGNQFYATKSLTFYVRPVRAF